MINFKNRTLRNNNNFINLSFLAINLVFSCLCAFNLKYAEFFDLGLLLSTSCFGLLPIYYFQKQFSSKGKHINILPLSMKKTYLITVMDWFIVYVISGLVVLLIFNQFKFGYKTYFYTPGLIFDGILGFVRINFLTLSVMIILKFYKRNNLLILGVGVLAYEIITILGDYLGSVRIFSILFNFRYLINDIGIFILSSVVFFFMISKLDNLSIE